MRKAFQMIFCVAACVCLAVAIPLLAVFGLWGLIPLGGALFFAILMLFMKNGLPRRGKPEPHTDFMNTDEENEAIRKNTESRKDDNI